MELSREEFENKCMDIIEQIVYADPNMDLKGAIIVAAKLLEKAEASGKTLAIQIYTRVLNEFKITTEEDYNALKKQIFS